MRNDLYNSPLTLEEEALTMVLGDLGVYCIRWKPILTNLEWFNEKADCRLTLLSDNTPARSFSNYMITWFACYKLIL